MLPARVGRRKKLPPPGRPGWGPKSDPLRLGTYAAHPPTDSSHKFPHRPLDVTFRAESCRNARNGPRLHSGDGGRSGWGLGLTGSYGYSLSQPAGYPVGLQTLPSIRLS